MNNQAAFASEIQKHQIQREVFLDFFVRFISSIWGVCPTRRGMFHETEANFANLRFVFRGEIHQPREAGPPERPQCEARWPLAQRRPPTGLKNKIKAVANPIFHPSLPPQPHEHQLRDDYAQKFDRCIPVAAARLGIWGGASPSKRSQDR